MSRIRECQDVLPLFFMCSRLACNEHSLAMFKQKTQGKQTSTTFLGYSSSITFTSEWFLEGAWHHLVLCQLASVWVLPDFSPKPERHVSALSHKHRSSPQVES